MKLNNDSAEEDKKIISDIENKSIENKTDIEKNEDKSQNDEPKEEAFSSKTSSYSDKRRIIITISTFIIALLVLVISINALAIGLYNNEDKSLVKSVADNTVQEMQSAVNESDDFSILNSYADDYMGGYSNVQNIEFFLCNSRGSCVMASQNYTSGIDSITLSEEQRHNIEKNNSFDPTIAGIRTDGFSILSTGRYFTVETKGIQEEYYMLVVYPDKKFQSFILTLVGISMVLFIAIVGIALVILINQYKAYVGYLTVYSEVVQRYARDDFSIKMPVPEHTDSDYFIKMIEATNELAVNIETSEERRKQFISNVSHELRTPMTSICGFVDGILDGTVPKSEERKYLTIVSQETRRLKNMIQSMLNLTRIESGTLQLPKADFNLSDVAVRTLFLFENQIKNKGVEVDCNIEESYKINGNQDYIQQVIYNLIENAVKFVNENGMITLTIEKSSQNHDFVDVSIRNTGDGIAADEIPKIFDRFYKTDSSRSKDKTGLGLGLTICKRIVYLHGGTIMVRSKVGEFTEFVVHLPFKAIKTNLD